MKLIAGIGNPGEEYGNTRHNIGWKVIDLLADKAGSRLKKGKLACWVKTKLEDKEVILVKPLTYVNQSGKALEYFTLFYKVLPKDVIVIHDDLDLDLGAVRIKSGGGDGGHNGLKSIIISLLSKDFLRIRIGIGKPSEKNDVVGHVLSPFKRAERKKAEESELKAVEAVCHILNKGETDAMNYYNRRKLEDNNR